MFRKFWNFIKSPGLMAVITLAGFAFGIYGTLFYEKRPGLALVISTNSTVFDVHKDIGNLDILYSGENLRKSNETLRLVTVSLVNSGKTDFVKKDFDETEPLGFIVRGGRILEIPSATGTNAYLRKHIRFNVSSNSQVTLAPIILEAGEALEFQTLILAPVGANITVHPIGKLAGIKQIELQDLTRSVNEKPFLERLLAADEPWIQLLRGPIYFVFFMLEIFVLAMIVAATVTFYESASSFLKKRERKKLVDRFSWGRPLSKIEKTILDYFTDSGAAGLAHLSLLIERLKERNELLAQFPKSVEQKVIAEFLRHTLPVIAREISDLEKVNAVKEIDLSITPADEFLTLLNKTAEELGVDLSDPKKNIALDASKYGAVPPSSYGRYETEYAEARTMYEMSP